MIIHSLRTVLLGCVLSVALRGALSAGDGVNYLGNLEGRWDRTTLRLKRAWSAEELAKLASRVPGRGSTSTL